MRGSCRSCCRWKYKLPGDAVASSVCDVPTDVESTSVEDVALSCHDTVLFLLIMHADTPGRDVWSQGKCVQKCWGGLWGLGYPFFWGDEKLRATRSGLRSGGNRSYKREGGKEVELLSLICWMRDRRDGCSRNPSPPTAASCRHPSTASLNRGRRSLSDFTGVEIH